MARPEQHPGRGENVGDRGEEADRQAGEVVLLNDQRQPDADAIGRERESELHHGQQDNASIAKRAQQRGLRPVVGFRGPHRDHRVGFFAGQPGRVVGLVGDHLQHDKTKHRRGQAHHDEHPLPAGEAEDSIHLQQQAAERRADQRGEGNGDQEPGEDAGAVFAGKPGGEIKRHARKKPGFGDAEQKAHGIEAQRPGNQRHGGRNQSPTDHDARYPAPRAKPV